MDRKKLEELHRAHVSRLASDTANALRQHGYDALVVHSGAPQKRTQADDQYWPLRVTPEFQHWLPLSEAGCALVVEPGRTPRLLRLTETSFWEAPAPSETDHFWSSFEVAEASSPAQMRDLLPRGRVAFIGDEAAAAAAWGIADVNPPRLVAALDQLRVHKTLYEEECVAEANRRAAPGHQELRRLFAAGDRSELDLHLAFLAATRQDDAEAPYKNIVALGAHSATLHHVSYSKRAQPAQRLLRRVLLRRDQDLGEGWRRGGLGVRGAGLPGGGDAAAAVRAGAHRAALRGVARRVAPPGGRNPPRDRPHQDFGRGGRGRRRDARLLPARPGAFAGAAVPRRGLRHGEAAAGQPVPAQHDGDLRAAVLHHRARHLFHRGLAAPAARGAAGAHGRLEGGRRPRALRRHPHRGRRRGRHERRPQPHPRSPPPRRRHRLEHFTLRARRMGRARRSFV